MLAQAGPGLAPICTKLSSAAVGTPSRDGCPSRAAEAALHCPCLADASVATVFSETNPVPVRSSCACACMCAFGSEGCHSWHPCSLPYANACPASPHTPCPPLSPAWNHVQWEDWAAQLCLDKALIGPKLAEAFNKGGLEAARAFNATMYKCDDGSYPLEQVRLPF